VREKGLFIVMDLEIGVDNVLVTRTTCIPGGIPARRSCLRPGLLLSLLPADFLVRSGPGFAKDLLEFFGF
jgi:hypothetical protein